MPLRLRIERSRIALYRCARSPQFIRAQKSELMNQPMKLFFFTFHSIATRGTEEKRRRFQFSAIFRARALRYAPIGVCAPAFDLVARESRFFETRRGQARNMPARVGKMRDRRRGWRTRLASDGIQACPQRYLNSRAAAATLPLDTCRLRRWQRRHAADASPTACERA